jgi:gas vesicle protein
MPPWFEHISAPHALIFIGTILTGIGGIWAAHRTGEVNRKLAEHQKQLSAKSDDIHSDVKRILDMVAEGKLTPKEAQELIAKLDATLGPLKAEIKTEVKRAEPEAR